MPKYSVTCVYDVEAPIKDMARVRVSEAVRFGFSNGVTLEFDSVRQVPDGRELSTDEPDWKAWVREARDQLLGPRKVNQQPAGKKSWS